MGAFTYRIPPCPYYDTKAMEAWLQDMAKKGLILGNEGIFPGIVAFEKAQPQNVRYRLVASEHPYRKARAYRYAPVPDGKTQAFHREFGWEYIATRRDFHIYTCADPNAPEMETDPQIQAMAYGQAAKRQRTDVLCYALIVAVHLFTLIWWAYDFLLGSAIRFPMNNVWLLLLWLFYLFPAVRGYRQLRLRQKMLKEGASLPPSPGYRKTAPGYWLSLVGKAMLVTCLFVTVFLSPPALYQEEEWTPLSQYTGEIPFATMEELLPEAQLREDIAWNNHILTTSTILADTWQLRQQLHITLPDGTKTSGNLNIIRRHTRIPSAAHKQAADIYSKGESWNQEPVPLSIEGVDCAFYYADRTYDYVVLQKNNIFLSVDFQVYNGDPISPEQIARIMAPYLTGQE